MNESQRFRLTMLKEIHDICQKNGITYFLAFGTLLGAVRSGGFLPWDDDADICMVYDQWKLFQEACKTDLPPNRHVSSADTDDDHNHLLSRYSSTDTTAYHSYQSLTNGVAGEVIDIFLLDPIGDGREAWRSYFYDVNLLDLMANYAHCTASRQRIPVEEFDELLKIQHEHGKAYVCKLLTNRIEQHFDENGSCFAVRYQGTEHLFERSIFKNAVPIMFEGIELMMPDGAVPFLRYRYGDRWFDLPDRVNPDKHRIGMSYRFPYTEALDLFQPKYDRKKLLADMEEWRRQKLDNADLIYGLMDERSIAVARATELSTMKLVESERNSLQAAIDERDVSALAQLVGAFAERLSSAMCIGSRFNPSTTYRRAHPVIMKEDPTLIEASVVYLFGAGHINQAAQILETCAQEGIEFTQGMRKYWKTIGTFRRCVEDCISGDHERGLDAARELSESFPSVSLFLQLRCAHLHAATASAASDELQRELDDCLTSGRQLFPGDGFFLWLEADLETRRGALSNNDVTLRLTQAAEHTRNGFLLRDIAERTGYYPTWMRNAPWATPETVPDWHGDEPFPLNNPSLRPKSEALPDAGQRLLFDLLVKLCETCEERGIPYLLSPATAKALLLEGGFPAKQGNYAIVCTAHGAKRIVEAIESGGFEERTLRYMGNDASARNAEIEFHSSKGVYLPLMGSKLPSCTTPFVRVFILETEDQDRGISHLARQWRKARKSALGSSKLATKAVAFLHRVPADRDAAGKRIFDLLAKASVNRNDLVLKCDQASKPVTGIDPSAFEWRSFNGHDFRVPCDFDAYAEIAGNNSIAGPFLSAGKTVIQAPNVSLGELIEDGSFDIAYFERKRELAKRQKKADKLKAPFNENFKQLREAIDLKNQLFEKSAEHQGVE